MAFFNKNKKKVKDKKEYKDKIEDQDIYIEKEEIDYVKDGDKEVQVKKKVKQKLVEEEVGEIEKGDRTLKDLVAPDFNLSEEGYLKVGEKYVRSFAMKGYPPSISVGWIDDLLNSDADIDTVIYIEPADDRRALKELSDKIVAIKTQILTEQESGRVTKLSDLQHKQHDLERQRDLLEQNFTDLFHVQIISSLYADTKKNLEKETQRLNNRLSATRKDMSAMYLRQFEAYNSTLPFGDSQIPDFKRNLDTGAAAACFPFYNSELSHENGVHVGINLSTGTPVYIDFFDRSILNNSNISIFGETGAGKTFAVSILILRSVLKQIKTVIIDPESDYLPLTQAVGGAYIDLSSKDGVGINPFDIEEEEYKDNKTGGTYWMVNIPDKISDLTNLISVMAKSVTTEQSSLISEILLELYTKDWGITEDPESLYEDEYFDTELKKMVHGRKKEMPTFSDFHKKLEEYAIRENSESMKKLSNSLLMFKKDGIYGLFDRQTSKELESFADAPVISFDVSKLEEGVLRPIGMYIAMSWTWEKFLKKDVVTKKLVVCDEAWMLLNKDMEGYEYTSKFLETLARRIRKRMGGLVVASQNLAEFTDSSQGRAIINNTAVQMIMKMKASSMDSVSSALRLSAGEEQFVLSASKGEMLIKLNDESVISKVLPFPYEFQLLDNPLQTIQNASYKVY